MEKTRSGKTPYAAIIFASEACPTPQKRRILKGTALADSTHSSENTHSNPEILAKSPFSFDQIRAKEAIGCDGIEYQMLPDDFDAAGQLLSEKVIEELIADHPARAVHLPMSCCNVEDPATEPFMVAAVRIAQHSHDLRKEMEPDSKIERPIVVLHNEHHFDAMRADGLDHVAALVTRLVEECPDIVFTIENTTAHRFLQKGSTMLSSGYYDSPVKFVEYLQERVPDGTKRVFSCLDICHAAITKRHMASVAEQIKGALSSFSLAEFFELYAPTLGLMHFAGFSGSGYEGSHATPFVLDGFVCNESELLHGSRGADEQNLSLLHEAIGLYRAHECSCPITLEINEPDVLRPRGYEASRQAFYAFWHD